MPRQVCSAHPTSLTDKIHGKSFAHQVCKNNKNQRLHDEDLLIASSHSK